MLDFTKLDKESYTVEELKGLLEPIKAEYDTLKSSVADGQAAITKVKELESANLTNAIKLEATKAGLNVDDVFDLIDADSLEKAQGKINKLVEMSKQEKINKSFKPEDRKSTDEYGKHEKDGNVEGMLSSKLSKLFG